MTPATPLMIAILCCVASVYAEPAQAATAAGAGWYAGADLGRSEYNFDSGEDFSDMAFAVHGGYRFARHFAVEAGYADLGSYDFTYDCPQGTSCVPELFPVRVDVSSKRLDLALLGMIPLGQRWEAHAKLGYARTEFDVAIREGLSSSSSSSTSSSDVIYGVGLGFHFDAPWSLRLRWERIPDINDSSARLDTLWLSAEYRFGG